MAVLIEALSVVVKRSAVEDRLEGGWSAFRAMIPNATGCWDDRLARVGFMTPTDVEAFVSMLEACGLVFRSGGEAVDLAVVDQVRGPTVPAPWLQVGRVPHAGKHIMVAWINGEEPSRIAVPAGWKMEGSLSASHGFVPTGTEDDRIKFLRREGGVDVYLDLRTGKEVYVGRSTIKGATPEALLTQLHALCHEVLALEAEAEPLKALGDESGAAPLFQRLEHHLEEAESIVGGPGRELAFAHFTHGLALRVLGRFKRAEKAFRRANDLQPDSINTLRELVLCLGKQGRVRDALEFAKRGTEVAPTDAGAWGNLAMCLIQSGERAEARKAIDFAIDLDPQDPKNRYLRDNFDSYFQ